MTNPLLLPLLLLAPGALAVRLAWPKKDLELTERMGLALGLSLAITPIILSFVQFYSKGVREDVLWAIWGPILLAALVPKSRANLRVKVTKWDGLMSLVMLFAFVSVFSIFTKYPFFPRFYSHDFMFHLDHARQYLQGTLNPLTANYPPSTHVFLASGLLALGGDGFQPTQLAMALIVVLSTLLIYSSASLIFGDKRVAMMAGLVYIVINPMWTIALQNSGIYSNLISNLSAIVLFVTLAAFSEKPTRKGGILLLLVSAGFYITHFTSPLILPMFFVYAPLVLFLQRAKIKAYLVGTTILTLPVLALAYVRSDVLLSLLASVVGASPPLARFQPTLLTDLLGSFSQFFLFLYLEGSSETLFFFTIISTMVTAAWLLKKKSDLWMVLPFIWFVYILAVSTISPNLAWRFAYNALAPLALVLPKTLLLAYEGIRRVTVRTILTKRKGARPTVVEKPRTILRSFLLLGVAFAVLYNSSGVNFIADVTSDPLSERVIERSLMESIEWIKKDTPQNARFLAVTEWKYLYLRVLGGREATLEYYLTPEQAFEFSKAKEIKYVIVTAGRYPGPDKKPTDFIELYNASESFERVYSNIIVSVYKVKV